MIDHLIRSCVILESLQKSAKEAVWDEMLDALVTAGQLPSDARAPIRAQLEEREGLGSTGIGNGVALPHSKRAPIPEMVMALARSVEGLDYDAIDGRPVQILFMILTPVERADDHLQALRWVSGLARNADFRRFMVAAASESEMRDLLREMTAA